MGDRAFFLFAVASALLILSDALQRECIQDNKEHHQLWQFRTVQKRSKKTWSIFINHALNQRAELAKLDFTRAIFVYLLNHFFELLV